jgi:hypothetical protein
MERERALYAHAVGANAPDREVGVAHAFSNPDDNTLERLQALALPFHDAEMDTYGRPRANAFAWNLGRTV